MSRLPQLDALYAAADAFKRAALLDDDSMFTPGQAVWSAPVLDDFYERFVGRPVEGADPFEVKFERQLGDAPADTIQLAAEILYVYFLGAANIYAETKRRLIERVLSWSPGLVQIPDSLESGLGVGMATVGAAFNTYRPAQIRFILELGRSWKRLDELERSRLIADPWAFREFLFDLPINSAHAQREAVLHLAFPDTFEPIVSHEAKQRIVERLGPPDRSADTNVDVQLGRIRAQLEPTYGPEFSFYAPDVAARWRPDTSLWGQFIAWARRFCEWEQFDAEERNYKLEIGKRLVAARAAVRSNDTDWRDLLRRAFDPPNNLLNWRLKEALWKWCDHDLERARTALAALWDDNEDLAERITSTQKWTVAHSRCGSRSSPAC